MRTLLASLLLAPILFATPAPLAAAPALVAAAPALVAVPPLAFSARTLPNGLRVYAMPDRTGTTVSVQVWYDVGGRDDPRGHSGFAHLFEHLMFKGTRDMPPEEMDRLTDDVGGSNNASTDDDFTEFHEIVPANHLQRLLWAEAERMSALVVDQANFTSEREVVKEELRGDAARPYGELFQIDLPQASYAVSPYARSPIGSIADLDRATLDDVRAFHALYYRPDNAVLVVSGNFDPAMLDEWVNLYFAPIARPARPVVHAAAAEPPRTAPRRYMLRAPNTPFPAVVLSWQLPPATDPDHAVITVLDGLLSGGESARLYQGLVYRDRVAVQTGSSADIRKGVGMFSAYAVLAGGKAPAEAEAALRREIARLLDAPVADDELTRVKNQIVTGALKGRETAEGRAGALAADVILEDDPHASDRRIAAIQAVTPADVRRVARRLLADDRAVTVTYLPAPPGEAAQTVGVAPTVVTRPLVPPADIPIVHAASAAERRSPPLPGAPVTSAVPVPVERRLANGMRLVVVERHALPIVSAYLVAEGGSSTDPKGKAGLAELEADLLTKGTATRSATDVVREVETLGGSIGGAASRDGMVLTLTAKSDVLEPALRVFADVALNPAFAPAEIDRQRAQAIDGLKSAYSAPESLLPMVASRAIFGDGPYGKPADGTPASLRALTHEDFAAAYATRWRPDAVTLVMAGDITPDQARALAETRFGGWRPPATPPAALPAAAVAPPPRTIVIDLPQSPQAAVLVGRVTIARGDPRYYSMLVAQAALGGGYSARLNQEIRVKRGLSYGAGSGFEARRAPGPLSASAQTKNVSAPQVLGLIVDAMRGMGAEPVPEAELDARKATLTGAFGRGIETTDGLAATTAGLVLEDVSPGEIGRYAASVNAVTAEEVRAVSRDLIDPAAASRVVIGDAALFLPALKAAGFAPEVIPIAKLDLGGATLMAGTPSP